MCGVGVGAGDGLLRKEVVVVSDGAEANVLGRRRAGGAEKLARAVVSAGRECIGACTGGWGWGSPPLG